MLIKERPQPNSRSYSKPFFGCAGGMVDSPIFFTKGFIIAAQRFASFRPIIIEYMFFHNFQSRVIQVATT